MYEAYWELSEPPFDNSPNPKFFYLSPEHEEALVRLVYTVRHRKGCGMLIGEYGCGKTTLSRALIQRLEAERYEIGLLTNPSWNSVDFLREALYQLGGGALQILSLLAVGHIVADNSSITDCAATVGALDNPFPRCNRCGCRLVIAEDLPVIRIR